MTRQGIHGLVVEEFPQPLAVFLSPGPSVFPSGFSLASLELHQTCLREALLERNMDLTALEDLRLQSAF